MYEIIRENKTVLIFSRLLNTCDEQDIPRDEKYERTFAPPYIVHNSSLDIPIGVTGVFLYGSAFHIQIWYVFLERHKSSNPGTGGNRYDRISRWDEKFELNPCQDS